MRRLHELYARVARAYGRKDEGGVGVRTTTALLTLLFGSNQPYSEARKVPCDVILELLEGKLDEGLSYLEKSGPRLARKQIAAEKAFGSVPTMVRAAMKSKAPAPAILAP